MARRYPIDGLWLTDQELARYFLGQLDAESHMRLRSIPEPEPIRAPSEADFQPTKPQARPQPQKQNTALYTPVQNEGLPL